MTFSVSSAAYSVLLYLTPPQIAFLLFRHYENKFLEMRVQKKLRLWWC